MKITVINGTPFKGITALFKEDFLSQFNKTDEITQFYPKDFPEYCCGCKNCFLKGESYCPHFDKVNRIREALYDADLIVFAYPSYALNVPASIKSLLDHLCVNWMVHRPNEKMFNKTAVILTNSVGMAFQQKTAQKSVKTALSWLGVSKIYCMGAGMMGDILRDKIKPESEEMLDKKAARVHKKVIKSKPAHMSASVAFKFKMCKIMHKNILKTEEKPSVDNQYFLYKGWIKAPRKHYGK